MKTIGLLFSAMASFGLLTVCEKSEDPKTETLSFEANFIGNYESVDVSETCGELPWMRIINNGGGTATLLESFTHHFDFCCKVDEGIYPGGYMEAYFVAENGDSLFVACAGRVIEGKADDHPDYVVSYFRDPFEILGGTGRFKGATGNGMTDDYNSSEDPYSHHHWEGTITLVK